ncbi:uncharacterized protein LOC135468199 [Liolophura sinensis]|uniref:uncharacterized protein LOC135468199 n=1 Tax=Liolophura sinensis TaxID=3198878 RepID=UPI0031585FE3
MSQTKDPTKALGFTQRSFVGMTLSEDDFGIPASPPSAGGPWKLTVHRDISPPRIKAKTPDPSFASKSLSVPDVSPGLSRRASCPNFDIPEFSVAPQERGRLMTKRPSIISQTVLDKFTPPAGIKSKQRSPSVIDEQIEYNVTDATDSVGVVQSSGNPIVPNVVLPAAELGAKKQRPGFLASRMASFFKSDSTSNTKIPSSEVDGVSPVTNVKKSYLVKRAATMTNTDVNAMAPSSM